LGMLLVLQQAAGVTRRSHSAYASSAKPLGASTRFLELTGST
jgi:hypothetical protein